MNPKLKIWQSNALVGETEVKTGETLLRAVRGAGLFVDAPCGGEGRCGKCLVSLTPGGQKVPACQTRIYGDMEVHISGQAAMGASLTKNSKLKTNNMREAHEAGYGVAIDIGTTTVVAYLIDLGTKMRIGTANCVNAQRAYGADVVSRIKYCTDNDSENLTRLIREQLSSLIREICSDCGVRYQTIRYIAIAGNTTMQHLVAGYSPAGLGTAPFEPISLFGIELPIWKGFPAADDAKVYYTPAITAYVGGDVTAGMLYAGFERVSGSVIYLDIGTNGEIALKHDGKYYCCAVAAGPAFEGAEITMGMAAVVGAISRVTWDGDLKLTVIQKEAADSAECVPVGICGSGLLDALALLLETGAVDESGKLRGHDEISHPIANYVSKKPEIGANVFNLSAEVYITASDIRKLQLAKAAIAAGIQTLLCHVGIAEDDIDSVVLAGGFGSYMDKNSAARVGLMPASLLPVAHSLGNAAGEGAILTLTSTDARKSLEDIRAKCEYVELSTNETFKEQFIEQMGFSNLATGKYYKTQDNCSR